MATSLPQIPYKTKFLNAQGYVSEPWAKFLRDLYIRVGGTTALSNTELAGDTPQDSSVTSLTTRTTAAEADIKGLQQEPTP